MPVKHSDRRQSVRLVFLALLTAAGFAAVFAALAGLCLPDPAGTQARTQERVVRIVHTPSSRGQIFDRNGAPLVGNRTVYTLMLQDFGFDRGRRCEILSRVLELLEAHGMPFSDSMPVSGPPFAYTWDDPDSADARRMAAFLRYRGLDPDLDAEKAMQALRKSCEIPAAADDAQARALLGVFYELYRKDFSAKTPFVFARGLDKTMIAEVSEDPILRKCLYVGVSYERVYETACAAHILGRVGPIPAEQAASYTAEGYPLDARVGLDGAEAAFESLLRGTDGMRTVQCAPDGTVETVLEETPAVSGRDVYLSIDLTLQTAAEQALETRIAALNAQGEAIGGGAAVVLDVSTGEVLALASWPTYCLETFAQDYAALAADARKPLFDRAIAGTYAPGSTFKMCTATAALQSGVITPETVIECTGVYDHYAPEYLYRCWIYNERGETHGPLRVDEALAASCNIFFYEVGRLCGIEWISRCARLFGLGEYTEIELPGEAKGIAASRKARAAQGRDFYPGDTLQAAIGQSDNLFTPLQLAAYVAAVANGGTRCVPHILLRACDAQTGETVLEKQPEIAAVIPYTDEDLGAILSGMRAVASDGTARSVFADYPVAVLGKSGSAQVASGAANAIFVLAAPADAPQIAVCVVIEHGARGNNAALAARDILDAYFGE